MPRGRAVNYGGLPPAEVHALESELADLRQKQADVRARLRKARGRQGGVRKLEVKLERQLATAKWTVQQIREIDRNWDELGFYKTVIARKPLPRGRAKKVVDAPSG